ncbi:hypothetical protein R3P38DRAFT_2808659 [Favolaschia claudopus]|uniref:Uncharacterized protein n=1 Tax=Favolaschia claudopus TaxID=2862362 RepID=A0AAV9ZFH9_9AGAR
MPSPYPWLPEQEMDQKCIEFHSLIPIIIIIRESLLPPGNTPSGLSAGSYKFQVISHSFCLWSEHKATPNPIPDGKRQSSYERIPLPWPNTGSINGKDEDGRTNNFMNPALNDLALKIMTMGRRPLYKNHSKKFKKYTSSFVAALSILPAQFVW